MSIISEVGDYAVKQIDAYPALEKEIVGIFDLFMMEVYDECASPENEAELFYSDVDTTIHEYKRKNKMI